MRHLTRPALLNLALYAPLALACLVGLVCALLGAWGAGIVAVIVGGAWIVLYVLGAWLFEPALVRWVSEEPASPRPAPVAAD